ncbi:MAG: NADH-quinone oxidoreductase subunit L [Rhodobacteraceae bacterium]|nr:NADH-quinone oxidoreductase subunit L [Paracoccaceae bacterium]QEW21326.1 NADH-quinone oxidoreductase subunit L [Marinibacterium anthonyi]
METILLFAPLVGAIVCGFGWTLIGEKAAQWTATGLLFLSAFLSWIVFFTFDGVTEQITIMRWIESGTLSADWMIRMDRLTAIMLIVITTVSSLVHLYSFGYMAHDENFADNESYRARFFAYLSLFTFAMLMLVTSDNLAQMFFGWEGVGLASYLLIGFYFRKPSANKAAMKAFIVNRVGDFGFALGIFVLYYVVDSISLSDIFASAPTLAETQLTFLWRDWNAAEVVGILLFIGAMGKSAQLFLHTWLPDAMEGPTPVSALIHAATMVTAGVFLVCRMSPVYEFAPYAAGFITVIGATTAFFAATVGLVQTDIKRVIAYSTCSQLGYMFVAAGVGMYSAAMFHLLTHAFFKALLFLCAGSVIHAMHHEQDMMNYGGLRKKIPFTFWTMVIGTLAITGVGIPLTNIGFAGFLSKDAIIESAWAGGTMYGFWMLVIAAAFTSFYSWRLIFLTFFGEARGNKHAHEHAHESPRTMLVPLGVLAFGAVFAGMIWYGNFFGHADKVGRFYGIPVAEAGVHAGEGHADTATEATEEGHGDTAVADTGQAEGEHHVVFAGEPGQGALYMAPDNHVLEDAHASPVWVKVSPFIAMLLGLGMAYLFYIVNPALPGQLARNQRPLYLFLLNKWYFDELYDAIFVRPTMWIGRILWKEGDGKVIDGSINSIALGFIPFMARLAGRAQTGYIFTYAFAMVIGIAIFVTWMTLTGGAE